MSDLGAGGAGEFVSNDGNRAGEIDEGSIRVFDTVESEETAEGFGISLMGKRVMSDSLANGLGWI